MYREYNNLIKKMAWGCLSRLPLGYNSISLEDLEQEGRIVLMTLLRKRYKPSMGKFSTLLSKALINRYAKIIREINARKRLSMTVLDPDAFEEAIIQKQKSQHEELERKEMMAKIRKVDEDLADLIEIGVPEELFIYARNQARSQALKNKTKIHKISFAKGIIEGFYGIKFNKILKLIHSDEPSATTK